MIITLVMDQYGMSNNGTTASAMRYAQVMRDMGHTVRIVTCVTGVNEENVYVVPKREFPIVMRIVRSQGMELGLPDDDILTKAIKDADIVHFFLPFILERAGKEIADKYHVASTAAFHMQPENITSTLYLNGFESVNNMLYRSYRKFYNKFDRVHAPSEMIKEVLVNQKYTADIRVISNGVLSMFRKKEVQRPPEFEGKILIMMSGRHSREKRQDLLIKAAAKSKYADKIQLILCGKGPWKKTLQGIAEKHKPDTIFPFYSLDEMVDAINMCDLYVHASDVETEAISCIEAFTCGLVPIISDSDKCATRQFALTERNLFRRGDVDDLVEKIEYLIEHPEEKKELSDRYLEYAEQFRLENCVPRLVQMFEEEVENNRQKWGDLVGKEAAASEA